MSQTIADLNKQIAEANTRKNKAKYEMDKEEGFSSFSEVYNSECREIQRLNNLLRQEYNKQYQQRQQPLTAIA